MQNIKTKNALLFSVISIMLCVTMLIGGTYAWFTDEASTRTNSIFAGVLNIELQQYDEASGNWIPAENTTLKFIDMDNNDLWEPGCTYSLPKLRIKNNSDLALDYEIVIDGVDAAGGLNPAIEWTITGAGKGSLLPTDECSDEILITGHMREDAGNEFQGLMMNGITVTVYATQKTEEFDSNGNQYDADAKVTEVSTLAELQQVISKGGYARLIADIDAATAATRNQRLYVPAGVVATLDLNGHTLTSKDGGGDNVMAVYVDRAAHLTIEDSVGTGKIVSSCYGIYVQPNAMLTMNGGSLIVKDNPAYDMGVVVWNGSFVMNGGSIEAQFGVWTYNYYKDLGEAVNTCSITVADGCEFITHGYDAYEGYEDLDKVVTYEAPDTVVNLPAGMSAYFGE